MRRYVGLAAVIAAGVFLSGCGYNQMVTLQEQVDQHWAEIDNQLQRRNDLIPNLVEVTKGYAGHEREIFTTIAEERSKLIGSGSRSEAIEHANGLSSALGRLLAISENYPDLKANQQFQRLSDELAGTENRIAVARRRYNETVQQYNTYIKKFPQMFLASTFGFEPTSYFEVPEEARELPEVQFDS